MSTILLLSGCHAGQRGLAVPSSTGGRTVVVLIHGTFASQAPWTRPGSWFSRSLTEALARRSIEATTTFIDWSGGNTHRARLEGSQQLIAHIRGLALCPEDACFLVGHSHGGNVALHAMVHDLQTREQTSGIVTLATPFLYYRDETPLAGRVAAGLDASALASLAWAAVPLASTVLLLPLIFLMHRLLDWKIAWINGLRRGIINGCSLAFPPESCRWAINGTAGIIDSGIAIIILLAILFGGFFSAEDQWVDERRNASVRKAAFACLQPAQRLADTPILAMSAPVDEALQFLNASWWIHRVMLWILRLSVAVALIAGIGSAIFALKEIGFDAQARVGTDAFTLASTTLAFLAKVTLIPLAFSAGALIGAGLRALTGLPTFGFGTEAGQDNMHWTVTAHRHPCGVETARFRSYGLMSLMKTGGPLIHSRLYASEKAIEDIADFISGEQEARRDHHHMAASV